MERITVNQLANEFNVQSQVVIGELKKLGIYVSAAASVDLGLAERVRKKLQALKELEEAKAQQPLAEEKKSAKKKEKPAKSAAEPAVKPKRYTVRKRLVKEPEVQVQPKPVVEPLAPRKGKHKYTEYVQPEVEQPETKVEPVQKLPPREAQHEMPAPPRKIGPVVEKPVETKTEPVAPEKKIAAEVVPMRREEKPAPPPKSIKPQILKKTAAEGPASVTDISERIFKIPIQKPAPERVVDRFKPVRKKEKEAKKAVAEPPIKVKEVTAPKELKPINLTEGLTIKELAEKINVKAKDIMQSLIQKGVLANINQVLETERMKGIAAEFGYVANIVSFEEELVEREKSQDQPEAYVPRAPVVTIMGHVDHGKTTLLDAIRESRIAEKEAGGITQHIGAYKVEVKDFSSNGHKSDRSIVFLDTPGHEAFTLMRARGAQVTDIVILVVAADDGVMPQTVEAIHHAKAANVPIIVAINKVDKPEAQPDRVKQMLVEHGLLPEAWGGDTVMVELSAKKRTNIDLLLEMILLVADLRELKANPNKAASGVVLEARLDRTRGAVATVLVQDGTLRIGDVFLAGATYGKVRAMFDDRGRGVKEAQPSSPVEVLGLEGVPQAGDRLIAVDDLEKAKRVSFYRQSLIRERTMIKSARLTLDHLYDQLKQGAVKELPVVLKADVQGSVEVLTDTLNKLSTEKIKIRIIHSGTGAITESDVLLASASNAIIIGFNVRPEKKAKELAEQESVDIRLHTIIYNVTTEIKNAMVGLLEHTIKEKYLGTVEIRATFRVPKIGVIGGAYVSDGVIKRGCDVRLLRDNVVIYEGKLGSLKRFKDDVDEVKSGYECGLSIEKFNDIKVGDTIEAFVVEKIQPTVNQL